MTVPRALTDDAKITGVWAVLNGMRFRSTRIKPDGTVRLGYTGAGFPGHPAFSFAEATGAWHAVVPATECDQIVEISHQATYRGRLCDVAEVDGTGVGLYLVRGDDVTADDLGFEMRERGVYWKFVALADLDDYYEVHRDVFFPYWQQLTFGFAPHAGNWEQYVPDPELPEVGYDRFRLGRFAVVNGIEQPADDFPTGMTALYEVSVLANYHGEEYQVSTIWPGGMATLRRTGDGAWALGQGFTEVAPGRFEKQAHVGTLYNYREIQRDLLFDRWLAERAARQRP
jgi:hypothetical protein